MKNGFPALLLHMIFLSLVNGNLFAQSHPMIAGYDSIIHNQTIDRAYKIWLNSEYSDNHLLDTILCQFISNFDTLNLNKIQMDEKRIKSHISIAIDHEGLYQCECEVYDSEHEMIGTFGVFNDYYVFSRDVYNFWPAGLLRERILGEGDMMVFIPQSKVHVFNFEWRMVFDKDGELKWYNTKHPKELFDSEVIFRDHWKYFLLLK